MDNYTPQKAGEKDRKDWLPMAAALWPDCSRKELNDCFTDYIKKTKLTTYIVRDQNKTPVAFIQLSVRTDYVEGTTTSPVAYVEGIYVTPTHRKRGIAKQLVTLARHWAKTKHCKQLASDAYATNRQSRTFHKKMGFREQPAIVCFVRGV